MHYFLNKICSRKSKKEKKQLKVDFENLRKEEIPKLFKRINFSQSIFQA